MDSSRMMYIALKFNEMINKQDLNGLVELMTDDHVLIDIPGEIHRGKEVMEERLERFL